MIHHDPIIKHINNSFTTAAACNCCIVLPQAVHLTVLNILHDTLQDLSYSEPQSMLAHHNLHIPLSDYSRLSDDAPL